jgi:hypothetical protein
MMPPKEREALSGQCSSLSGASNFGVRVHHTQPKNCVPYRKQKAFLLTHLEMLSRFETTYLRGENTKNQYSPLLRTTHLTQTLSNLIQ